mgnify:CR=1 FL=1
MQPNRINRMGMISLIVCLCFLAGVPHTSFGQTVRTMERLDRGLVAIDVGEKGVYLSWRLLGTDPKSVAFRVYRDGKKVNSRAIADSTNFLDANGAATSRYSVQPLVGTRLQKRSAEVSPQAQQYVHIPLTAPASVGLPDQSSPAYKPGDASVGDLDGDGEFNKFNDKILVGVQDRDRWKATVFEINFKFVTENTFPEAEDVYEVRFNRPFFETDSLRFTVQSSGELDIVSLRTKMDSIQVVPNPYVVTNMMETAVANPFLNQRRKLMFTHIPAECVITIFTVSGTLVDRIVVDNADPENGIAHWDMLTREGLEIAAGMYLYHIEAMGTDTPETKTGKFAVIK